MNDFRADLHCHSTCSDGTVTPEGIIELAIQKGLKGLSITDHDTIDAYETALPLAEKLQFPLISGVEFSTSHAGRNVHLLGYSFALNSPLIHDFCIKHMRRREQRNQAILDLLTQHGMPVSQAELHDRPTPLHSIGRPHIALAMLKKGYVTSIQDAFNRFIGEGKPCYSSGGYFTTEETIDLIHRANGFAILAHPHLMENSPIIKEVLTLKLDGLEGYYARLPVEQQKRWVQTAEKKGWLITGGSDFHGDIKPTIGLGCSWVNEDTFKVLHDQFTKNQTCSTTT